ncbi:alanine--glyoxylate aminotransferase family protein [Sedimentibacter hydroxybenzoicus DSM 7310]|uniref:Alanine--glyoxylate aminotransferase family protein n=1 Tax=Sedimentibacter hydroxybenzoicus DSM 7310 TaxID=1123245 RepID=A0A974GUZ3_SEDHY|nr:alanine--glyoxylate aminotransferase family protein [Sedimentibacter hydroxybenzoicus]NYB72550.1 alanine--glyoxylate aminotransferase family protein [Sedimentibacter hydroxybenzoicus DSM 7310]
MKNNKLVMIPGPTPTVRSITDQMGRETVAFGDPAFVRDFKELVINLKTLLKADGECFVVAGSGTLAMEMAVSNVTKRGDNILIVSNGFFGDRFIDICERKGLNVDLLQAAWGEVISPEEIESKLKEKHYAAITVTHVDTSTGAGAPIQEIGKIMRNYPDTIYIVDGVAATAGEREYVDDYGIDILFTGSQKAFGVAPGLLILWAGKKALERRKSIGTIPEYYVDFEKWIPIMNDPAKYFATPAVNMIWALKESVRLINEEGAEARYDRHTKVSEAINKSLEAIGFKLLANEKDRCSTLSVVLYPEGINDLEFRTKLAEEGVMAAGALAAYAGKAFRVGHMGNIDDHTVYSTIAAIERTLIKLGYEYEKGIGLKTLLENI